MIQIFLTFFKKGITVPNFFFVGYVTDVKEGDLPRTPVREHPQNVLFWTGLNLGLSYLVLSKQNSGIKNGPEVTSNLPSKVVVDYGDDTNFPHKFLRTAAQVLSIRKVFRNSSLANIKLSETSLSKMVQ